MRTIDPVKLREARVRSNRRVAASMRHERAVDALLWFHEYAMNGLAGPGGPARAVDPDTLNNRGPHDALGKTLIIPSCTPGVEKAAPYVAQAFIEMRAAILTRAIEMAQAEVDAAEEELK